MACPSIKKAPGLQSGLDIDFTPAPAGEARANRSRVFGSPDVPVERLPRMTSTARRGLGQYTRATQGCSRSGGADRLMATRDLVDIDSMLSSIDAERPSGRSLRYQPEYDALR